MLCGPENVARFNNAQSSLPEGDSADYSKIRFSLYTVNLIMQFS